MKTFRLLSGSLGVLAFILTAASGVASTAPPFTFIPAGSVWRYSANGADLGTAWREAAFNDSAWQSGTAQLGFGDGDEVTTIQSGAVTVYFRHAFQSPVSGGPLALRLLRDDGAVVYLNGIEVFRNNMPAGPVSYNTVATTAVGGAEESTQFITAQINSSAMVQGANVVAVEVHQVNITSSDLSFDLELSTGEAPMPPIVSVEATDSDAAESGVLAAIFPGRFTFRRHPADSNVLTVPFLLSGTAENGVDYRYVSNHVRFNPGQAEARVDIIPLNDALVESTETVVVTLQNPVCATIVPPPPGCYLVGPSNRAEVFIRDANSPPNQIPYVELTHPRNGEVFTAPTDVALRAFAHDAEDGENITVEFFANGSKLGTGTYVPALCPGPPCPNYQFIWTDPAIGNHTLTARATDSSGVSSTSAPVTITVQPAEAGTNTLIAMGSVWKYMDNGSDQGTAWRQASFNDSAWASGPAQLGYGDGDEATVVSSGPDPINRYITTYFRRAFNVVNAASFSELRGRLLQDDGGVVYLNGVEIFRSNMPPGPIAFNTLAVSASPDNQIVNFSAPASLLVEGRNVVAVEMHQVNPSSSDLSFDLELIGIGGPPPPPDLPVVNVFATDPDAAESGPLDAIFSGTFTLSRTGPTSNALTAFFTLSGSAENGVDYLYVSNSVRFAPGQSQAHVGIVPLNDDLVEGTENVVLTLEEPGCIAIFPPPPGCYRVGSSDRAEVFIRDANVPPPGTNVTLVASRSIWKYLDNGSDQGTAWRAPAFDDSAWASGQAQLGYGDGDEATVVSFGPDPMTKYITTYFRRAFNVVNAASFSELRGRLLQDDGGVVYLNGIEIFRSNMPSGPVAFNTLASSVSPDNQIVEFAAPASLLVEGRNVVAVEMHQVNASSTDLSFDLELIGTGGPPPPNQQPHVQLNEPRDGDIFTAPTNIVLRAYAEDRDDGYNLTVEFFANNQSLGFGTFVPALCPSPFCPYYELTWSNAPAGHYTLTARATDSSGSSSNSAPVTISVRSSEPPGPRPAPGDQEAPAVAANNEVYLVAWADKRGNDTEWDIYAARITPDGERLDPNGIRICVMRGPQQFPAVASDGRDFLVVWHDARDQDGPTYYDIFGARVTAEGVVLDPNGFPISRAPIDQFGPSLAFNGTHYLVAWYDYRNSDNERIRNDIYGARVGRDGGVLDPNGIAICTAENMQWAPGVGSLDGDWFVAWDDSRGQVRGSRVTGAGIVNNPDGLVLSQNFSGSAIRVAGNASGYLTAWNDSRNYQTTQYDIFARRATAAGQIVGGSEFLLCNAPGMQTSPALAAGNDQFLAVWIDDRDGWTDRKIFATRIGDNGVLDSNGFQIGSGPASEGWNAVSVGALNGQYLAAWARGFNSDFGQKDIVAVRVTPEGTVLDSTAFLVSTVGPQIVDSDYDGVPDDHDGCLGTVVGEVVNANGCSLAQLCPCDGPWRTHGEYVNCVIQHSWEFFRAGLITADRRREAIHDAVQSNCGRRPDRREAICMHLFPLTREECQHHGVQFVLSGDATGPCVLECSEDLVNWRTVEPVAITGWEVTCPMDTGAKARFYRVRHQ